MGTTINKEKVKLMDVSLTRENGEYILNPTYTVTTEKDKREITYHIPLDIYTDRLPGIIDYLPCELDANSYRDLMVRKFFIDAGFGQICVSDHIRNNKNACIWEEKLVETYTHEMTISEIEEKLGYKIKIVNEKER